MTARPDVDALVTYDVRVMLRGEGYAARTVRVKASSESEAQEKALAAYVEQIEVDDPLPVEPRQRGYGDPWLNAEASA